MQRADMEGSTLTQLAVGETSGPRTTSGAAERHCPRPPETPRTQLTAVAPPLLPGGESRGVGMARGGGGGGRPRIPPRRAASSGLEGPRRARTSGSAFSRRWVRARGGSVSAAVRAGLAGPGVRPSVSKVPMAACASSRGAWASGPRRNRPRASEAGSSC
jgi:hypothetical protein